MRAAHYSAVLHAIQVTMLIHKQGENPRDNSALAAELVPCVILSVARHPGIFSGLIELSTAGILRPPRRTQNDTGRGYPLRMTDDAYKTLSAGRLPAHSP